jgi:hypothetical protein
MTLSHRDHRVDDSISGAFWTLLAFVVALGALALVSPWPALSVGALGGLAALGGLYIVRSERTISEYVGDLQSLRGGGDASGWARVEVGSRVARERPIGLPSRRSPHARPSPDRDRALPPGSDPFA